MLIQDVYCMTKSSLEFDKEVWWNQEYSSNSWDEALCQLQKEVGQMVLTEDKGEIYMSKLTGFDRVAVISMGCYAKDYYYALYDPTVDIGDTVLVTGAASGATYNVKNILTVEQAAEACKKNITAEVICKVDMSAYEKRIADRAEKEKIKKQMESIMKKMDETKKYEMYAAENPELAELLKKFKELEG